MDIFREVRAENLREVCTDFSRDVRKVSFEKRSPDRLRRIEIFLAGWPYLGSRGTIPTRGLGIRPAA